MNKRNKLKIQQRLSVLTIAIGALLMIYMIIAESELGAIPLLLITAGIGWYFISRYQT